MSCNGCRVLRKGCSDGCVLRQCLRWIESPDAQGHATVFVAKFFGRAGMMALITSVPDHQRPALFQSLLYEACGRTINPVFGAVGLLCSGNWKLCQDAMDTVMKGGLLCQSSTGTGRPGTGFLPPQSLIPSASGRLSKVRLGRGYVNTATGAPFSAANNNYNNKAKSVTNFVTGRDLSLDSSTFAGTAGAVLKKREMDHDTGNPHALKQQRVGSFKVEARDEKEADEREDEQPQPQQQQQQQQQQHSQHFADGDEDRECKWKTSRSGHRNACMGRKFQESDSVVDCSRRPQDVEEVGLGLGLDLTLGSSSSAWKTMSSNRRGHRQQQLVVKRTTPGSPCHSSEADSDTTDLSISIQSQVDTVASAAAAAAAAAKALPTPSTPPPTGEVLRSSINNDLLLMDLLH